MYKVTVRSAQGEHREVSGRCRTKANGFATAARLFNRADWEGTGWTGVGLSNTIALIKDGVYAAVQFSQPVATGGDTLSDSYIVSVELEGC